MATLSPTGYIVLALVEQAGEATPYELKQTAASLSGLWALRHDQVYREPERLAEDGLLSERREEAGRRRRHFRLTRTGQRTLDEWRRSPTTEFTELRDLGLLQLLLGGDPAPLARVQLAAHAEKLDEYQQLARVLGKDAPVRVRRALNAGIGHEREYVRFWTAIGKGGDGS